MEISTVNTFLLLETGKTIIAKHEVSDIRISHWKFGTEFPFYGAALAKGTRLKVAEINKTPGMMWVKLQIPYSDPPRYLKLTPEEYLRNFELI